MSQTKEASVILLVPAYNVDPWRSEFLCRFTDACRDIRSALGLEPWVVFVDDGSDQPGTSLDFHAPGLAALECRSILARHCINRGQGAALQTALEIGRSPAL